MFTPSTDMSSSFQTKAAKSSRVTKNKAPSSLRRSGSGSPFSSFPRRKAGQATARKIEATEDDDFEDDLEDAGLVASIALDIAVRDTAQAISCIQGRMFSPIPEQRSGMNSVRIAEVLNFRRSLPPIVTVAHIQALLNAPTKVEREIAELVASNIIRKIVVPGRGTMGEAVVLVKDLEESVAASGGLTEDVKNEYISVLRKNPAAPTLSRSMLPQDSARQLFQAGFLTAATPSWTPADIYSSPGVGLRGTLTSLAAIQRAAAGPSAAHRGDSVSGGAVHAAGGTGGGITRSSTDAGDFNISLPNMGSYLKLLTASRSRLISLLSRSKFRQAPESVLRERWNGGIPGDDTASQAKTIRGEFAGMLPGRTTKWKQLHGVTFQWALEECVGAGMVEVFETRSVGRGVRAI